MFVLPDLPYPHEALAPTMSADTLRTHHGKHHAKYVEVMNQLLEQKGWNQTTLEEVVVKAHDEGETKLFNNAAQSWNHGFFWDSMTPNPVAPSGALAEAIERDCGGMAGLRERFVTEGVNHFASGWVWLAVHAGRLEVLSTHDADSILLRPGKTPLLLCDVWEHAYYLDYKQDRKTFLEGWFDKLANWKLAEAQLGAAARDQFGWRYPARVE
ncbi:superoxide dismutase [Caulobacter sp. 17J65-9]|uniref:Fe-Mn family superoxide dismutase n=1 Tax=Caulobacter sp. 17J65-9 TaxID=2709382 RepID=UPI0013C85028|nr:superoxide dismutase [Caulobacter sp. 17J65-9]